MRSRGKERRFAGATSSDAWPQLAVSHLAALLPALRGALSSDSWSPVLHVDSTRRDDRGDRPRRLRRARRAWRHDAGAHPASRTDAACARSRTREFRVRASPRVSRALCLRRWRSMVRHNPIPDFLKTVIVPGLGIVYAGKDKRNARIASDCYSATMRVIAGCGDGRALRVHLQA